MCEAWLINAFTLQILFIQWFCFDRACDKNSQGCWIEDSSNYRFTITEKDDRELGSSKP